MTNYILIRFNIFLGLLLFFLSCKEETKQESSEAETSSAALQILTSPVTGQSSLPYLTTDNKSIYLSWVEQQDSIAYFKYAQVRDSLWSTPDTIASGTNWFINWADFPRIAVNNNTILAHYLQKSDSGKYTYDVRYVLKAVDSSWSNPTILHNDATFSEHGFVSMLPYDNNFFVTWLDGRHTIYEDVNKNMMSLRAAIINSQGDKEVDEVIDNRVCDCCQTSAAITSVGPIVFYRDRSDSKNEVRDIYKVRWQDSVWSQPEIVFKDNWKINGCPVNGPNSDAKKNTVAVAWFTAANDKPKVQVAFSDNAGERFDTPIRVDSGNPLGRVDVVLLNEQEAVVTWLEKRADNNDEIFAVKVSVDGVRSQIISIASSSAKRSSGFPQVELLGDKLYFAWTQVSQKEQTVVTAVAHIDLFD